MLKAGWSTSVHTKYIDEIRTKTHLRNNGQLRSEIMQSNLSDVNAVDDDLSGRRLDDSEQAERQRRLPGTSTANDSDLQSAEHHSLLFACFTAQM